MKNNTQKKDDTNVFFIQCDTRGLSNHIKDNIRDKIFDKAIEASTNLSMKHWNNNDYPDIRHDKINKNLFSLHSESLSSMEIPTNGDDFTLCLNGHHIFRDGIRLGEKRFYNTDHLAKQLYDKVLSRANHTSHIDIILLMCEASAYDTHPKESTIYQLATSLQKYQRKSNHQRHNPFTVKGPFEEMSQEKNGIALKDYTKPEGSDKENKLIKGREKPLFFSASSQNPYSSLTFKGDKECLVRTTPHTPPLKRTLRFDINKYHDNYNQYHSKLKTTLPI